MRAAPLLLAMLASACFSKPGLVGSDAGDAPGSDGPSTPGCVGEGPFTVCLPEPLPDAPLELADVEIDTDPEACTAGTITGVVIDPQNGGPRLCTFAGTSVSIRGVVAARGALPLVIVGIGEPGTVTLEGGATLDVSSVRDQRSGAGHSFDGCPLFVATPGPGGGGAGGSFGSLGGAGGDSGGGGGEPGAAILPEVVRGGCAGQDGTGGGAIGPRGESGGAVYLAARSALEIAGTINASGEGGGGGALLDGGGGGGGSGGMIALYGATIDTTGATAWTHGGGGGGGADNNNPGQPGQTSIEPLSIGVGGLDGGNNTSAGGPGSQGAAPAATAANAQRGCGGGGGGSGVIVIVGGTPTGDGTFSPPP